MIRTGHIIRPRSMFMSYFFGLATLYDIFNSQNTAIDVDGYTDLDAMRQDFDNVGIDFSKAIKKYSHDKESAVTGKYAF